MMLNWLVSYCNYYGYYFYDQNNYSYSYQTYTPPVRSLTTNKMANNKNNISGGGNNQKKNDQQQSANSKAIEAANLKKALEDGQGLGKNGKGTMEPVGIIKNTDRKGLPATEEITKNGQEVVSMSKSQRRRRRRGRGGQVQKNDNALGHEANIARELAEKSKNVAEKAVEAANRAEQVADNIKTGEKNDIKMKVDGETKPRRKHSPIRAPTSPENKVPVKVDTKQNSVTSPSFPKTTKESISINNPITPQFLSALAECFHSEIALMQLRLEAAVSRDPIHIEDELIVAKIVIGQNQIVADHDFECIRTDLVGWIGVYQEEGMATPIFHSMTNNSTHITVVCENDYAYKCLLQCIDDITQMETMGSITLRRLPPITPLVYCLDAVYEGVARDSALFLHQLHLHKSKLYSENWVVVSHEVCPAERKTYFIFLIDERSALALHFHYSGNFLICMQNVSFRNRGIVTEDYLK